MVTEQRLSEILASIETAKIAVIGDFCLDVYWFLEMSASEKSVETGRDTQPVAEQRYSLGGAGNVVANLCALNPGNVFAFPTIGNDPFGHRMLAELDLLGADRTGTVIASPSDNWQTLAYCKPYVGTEELSRLDMGNFNRLPDALADALLDGLEQRLPEINVVVINEQVVSGIHTEYLRRSLHALIERHPETTFIYDGRHHIEAYPGTWLKINDTAAVNLCGKKRQPEDVVPEHEAREAAETLFARTCKPVFVTRGSRGCLLCNASGIAAVPGLQVIGSVDSVGAGDSFLSGLTAGIAAGASMEEAMHLGNFAARVTVTKLRQTGTASPDEIKTVGAKPKFVYSPELAEDPRQAHYLEDTRIEIVRELPPKPHFQCAIFDHDGTLSTLRQGWEEIMAPMMERAILEDAYDTADEALYQSVRSSVARYIDQTTGIQTLSQMQGLVSLVREYGMVPEERILDMYGYKERYDEALLGTVRERLQTLEKKELDESDFTIKNAVLFLRKLREAGIRCYLASGTDEEHVKAEAEAMGYADLFDGGIFGSVGDIAHDAKELVLERIISQLGDVTGRLVTFGDGPVEIRETQMRGGVAVGIASDEVRRFGPNPAKRLRLIKAGAHIVVPDFSQLNSLLQLLGIVN